MLKPSLVALIAAVALILVTVSPARAAADVRLGARLADAGSPVKGAARYEERARGSLTEQRLKVEIQNATPGATFSVRANGKVLGSITANALGRGELDLRVNGDNPGTGVPSLPHLKMGNTVTAGPLSGTLANDR